MTTAPSWVKLSTAWYRDEKIKLILEMPEGGSIVAVFLMMLALAGEKNLGGELILDDATPYDAKMLACILGQKVNTVRLALKVLEKFRMIQTLENRTIVITNWWKWQNLEGLDRIREQTAERNRKFRARKRLLELGRSANQRDQANAMQQKRDVARDAKMRHGASPEIETEVETEREAETETDTWGDTGTKKKNKPWGGISPSSAEGEKWHPPKADFLPSPCGPPSVPKGGQKTSSNQAQEELDQQFTAVQQETIVQLLILDYQNDWLRSKCGIDDETIRLVAEVYADRIAIERLIRGKKWLGALFGRPDGQAWSEREEALLKKLLPISPEDQKLIRWGYSLQKDPDGWSVWEYQRLNTKPKQSLPALLENFASECDKWRGARVQLDLSETVDKSELEEQ